MHRRICLTAAGITVSSALFFSLLPAGPMRLFGIQGRESLIPAERCLLSSLKGSHLPQMAPAVRMSKRNALKGGGISGICVFISHPVAQICGNLFSLTALVLMLALCFNLLFLISAAQLLTKPFTKLTSKWPCQVSALRHLWNLYSDLNVARNSPTEQVQLESTIAAKLRLKVAADAAHKIR